MKNVLAISLATIFGLTGLPAQEKEEIRLLIRGDDIGSTHAANLGCIESYREGIMRSVEIMVPCAWFPEAVQMLKEHPGLDVGVHITLTSEWEHVKWGPLTCAPSLTDEDGYFYPVIWPNDRFPESRALKAQEWKLEEIEAEMRAQIEMATRHIPQVSHLTCHMGCAGWDESVGAVYQELAEEYGLDIRPSEHGVKYFPLEKKGDTMEERLENFLMALDLLEPGNTYLYVEHPAVSSLEMDAVGHSGYYGVKQDRDMVTRLFTSRQIMKAIRERSIRLISYADL